MPLAGFEPLTGAVIDVSEWQKTIDWTRVAQSGVSGAYIRATYGSTGIDKQLGFNAPEAAKAGLRIGFYHLLRADSPALKQAEHFLRETARYKSTLPLAIDVEIAVQDVTLSKADYAQLLATFIQAVVDARGGYPVIYTSASQWARLVGANSAYDDVFSCCALWVAHYTAADQPLLPPLWTSWWLWQYTSDGEVDGISTRVDKNRVHPQPQKEPEMPFKLQYPVRDPVVFSQFFGENRTGDPDFYKKASNGLLVAHEGIDFDCEMGDPIYAAADGVVVAINATGKTAQGGVHALGKHIKIKHEHDGQVYQTEYCHGSNVVSGLRVGDKVRAGDLILYAGNSGNVVKNAHTDGVHLHFILRREGATSRGEKQKMPDGGSVIYPNDIVNPLPYFTT